MDNTPSLKHKAFYTKTSFFVCSALAVFFLLFGVFTVVKGDFPLLTLALFIIFVISAVVGLRKYNRFGRFVEVDVYKNAILIKSEKNGLKSIEPGNIEKLELNRYYHGGSSKTNVKIVLKGAPSISFAHDDLSHYDELIDKLEEYKRSNNL